MEDEAYTKEEKILPEYRIVKWEVVESFIDASNNLALFFRYRQMGKTNLKVFSDFKKYVLELYFKTPESNIPQINEYILDNKEMTNNEWINHFFALKKLLYDLGITNLKVDKRIINKNKAFLDLR